jgi:hypothetical protein
MLWLFSTFPVVVTIMTIFVMAEVNRKRRTPNIDDVIITGERVIEWDLTMQIILWTIFLVPCFVMFPAIGRRLAKLTGQPERRGIVALVPGLWFLGLPYLALNANRNAGLPIERFELPPMIETDLRPSSDRGRRLV